MEGGWKEREDRPGKIWSWRIRECCKLCNFSLLCKMHVEEGKAPSLPAQSLRQAVTWTWWGVLYVGGGNPLLCTSPPQRKNKYLLNTGNYGKLQIIAPQKTELPEREKILSFPLWYFMSTDWSHWCQLSLCASTHRKLEWRISITLFACFASYVEVNVCYFCYAESLRCTEKQRISSSTRHTKMKHGSS